MLDSGGIRRVTLTTLLAWILVVPWDGVWPGIIQNASCRLSGLDERQLRMLKAQVCSLSVLHPPLSSSAFVCARQRFCLFLESCFFNM
jgi:hypothetical protein